MLRKAVAYLLMFLSLLIGFQQAIMILQFKINQQQLEEIYCINKNAAELACHGECFLKKKLAEANDNQAEQTMISPIIHLIFTEAMVKLAAWFFTLPARGVFLAQIPPYTSPSLEVLIPPPNFTS